MNRDVGLKYRMMDVPLTSAVCLFRSIVMFPAGICENDIDRPFAEYV